MTSREGNLPLKSCRAVQQYWERKKGAVIRACLPAMLFLRMGKLMCIHCIYSREIFKFKARKRLKFYVSFQFTVKIVWRGRHTLHHLNEYTCVRMFVVFVYVFEYLLFLCAVLCKIHSIAYVSSIYLRIAFLLNRHFTLISAKHGQII